MTIKEFHDSIRQFLNIGQSQYYSPEDIDLQINNAIQDFYRKEYSHFEANQEITDTLGFFKMSETLTLEDGFFDLPDNWVYTTELIAALSDNTEAQLEQVPDSEWGKRLSSKAFPPDLEFPIARYAGNKKIEAKPLYVAAQSGGEKTDGVQKIELLYLRKPLKAKYGYDTSSDGTSFVYSSGESVQVDYPEIDHPRIMTRALKYLGISVKDEVAIQAPQIVESNSEGK